MSVLIKGIEMPKTCNHCPLVNNEDGCSLDIFCWRDEDMEGWDMCKERHQECPLVEVPPHGRLIDADDLLLEAKRISGPFTGDGWDNFGVYALIERQQTIIDAEDGYYAHSEFLSVQQLNNFFDKHVYCNGNGEDCFTIKYEFEREFAPKTNADRIRAMTDEELARFFLDTASEFSCPPKATNKNCESVGGWLEGCPKCWLNWLKREAEDES